jgi:hypothetical protein
MRKPWHAVVVLCLALPAVPSGNAVAAPASDAMLGAFTREPLLQAPVAARIARRAPGPCRRSVRERVSRTGVPAHLEQGAEGRRAGGPSLC